jgi:drug/metabolite transporter (DMT)-like permease
MNEKTLFIALFAILGIGFVGVLFVVFPWVFSHGFSNWAQTLIDDGLIIVCLIMFVYGFYMNTRMH